jgi:hypothetical protein
MLDKLIHPARFGTSRYLWANAPGLRAPSGSKGIPHESRRAKLTTATGHMSSATAQLEIAGAWQENECHALGGRNLHSKKRAVSQAAMSFPRNGISTSSLSSTDPTGMIAVLCGTDVPRRGSQQGSSCAGLSSCVTKRLSISRSSSRKSNAGRPCRGDAGNDDHRPSRCVSKTTNRGPSIIIRRRRPVAV